MGSEKKTEAKKGNKKSIKSEKIRKKVRLANQEKITNIKIVSEKKRKVSAKRKTIFMKKNEKRLRKQYTSDQLRKALRAVAEGVALRTAADTYGVPSATLWRKHKNPNKVGCKTGAPTVLTVQEEADIVHWALDRAAKGRPATKDELLDSIQMYMKDLVAKGRTNPFKNFRPGRHWYEGFMRRHTNLRIRTAQTLTLSRASVTEQDLRGWFAEIKSYLTTKNLLNVHPSQVFNCDETSIQLCPRPGKVLAETGASTVYVVNDANEKENITVLFMYNAEGLRAPPMILYPYQDSLPKKVLDNVTAGWGIGVTESGWMTAETFFEYITNVFYPWLLKEKIAFPVIIYLDGHSSHVTIPLVTFCRERQIEIISLHPNSTHIIQPLDIAFFHPFKDVWRKTIPKWKVQNNVMRLRKEHCPAVIDETLRSFPEVKKAVASGFRAAGLVPFNPEAVDYNVLHKKNKKKFKNQQQNESIENNDIKENQQSNNKSVEENVCSHLENFEKNISEGLFEEFKIAESNKQWTGAIDKKGLYEYWLSIKNNPTVIYEKSKPSIKSTTSLLNHKITLVKKPVEKPVKCVDEDIDLTQEVVSELNSNSDQSLIQIIEITHDTDKEFGTLETLDKEIMLIDASFLNSKVAATEESHLQFLNNEIIIENKIEKCAPNLTNKNELNVFSNIEFTVDNTDKNSSVLQENVQREDIIETEAVTQNSGVSSVEINLEALNDKENSSTSINQKDFSLEKSSFSKAFTMPLEYLPKKKKIKLEKTGKVKLPSAGTSEEWFQLQKEMEEEKRMKEEKIKKKKMLQEKKKQIAQEKKELQKKMNEIQQRIKQETL